MAIKIKDADGNEHELLTKEEQTEMVTGAVNRASKDLTKSLTTELTKSIGAAVTASLAETMTTFETKVDEKIAAGKPTEPKPPGGPAPLEIEKNPAFVGLKRQLDAATTQLEEQKRATAAEKAKQRDLSLRSTLRSKLGEHKLDADALDAAVGLLVDANKSVRYAADDSDDIVFTSGDSDVDLSTGLKEWAQTPLAKRFMPPRGASGSGERGGGSGRAPGAGNGKQPMAPGALGRMILNSAMSIPGGSQGSTE